MIDNSSKIQVRYLAGNQDLLDVQKAVNQPPETNYLPQQESVVPVVMGPTYRTAPDRPSGNCAFRRYPDGSLDYDHAAQLVVTCIHKVRDKAPLNSLDEAILGSCFPIAFEHLADPAVVASIRAVSLRVSPAECLQVAMKVANHLSAEMQHAHSCHAR